jgi:hypothetical protein
MRKLFLALAITAITSTQATAAGPAAFWGPAAAPSGGGYSPPPSYAQPCPINNPQCGKPAARHQKQIRRERRPSAGRPLQ